VTKRERQTLRGVAKILEVIEDETSSMQSENEYNTEFLTFRNSLLKTRECLHELLRMKIYPRMVDEKAT